MPEHQLRIGWLYPTLMSTYGDRGNVICLERRAQQRGIGVEIVPLAQDTDAATFATVDLVVGGGAQDRQQEIVMRDLQGAKAETLRSQLEAGVPGVFTCGSPQLLGHYYEPGEGQRIEGLGLLDLVTKHPGLNVPRCIGNVVFELTATPLVDDLKTLLPEGVPPIAIGFENHGGRTYLGQVQPLGKVIKGYGNNGEDGWEGAFHRHAIATYSHGPLLPKNPFLADWLLQTALRHQSQTEIALAPLDDQLASQARSALLQRLDLNHLAQKS
ncbi:MAG: type 1 glutamine amidotransferase [Cyanobacteria bacterium P01_G01_bin.54]